MRLIPVEIETINVTQACDHICEADIDKHDYCQTRVLTADGPDGKFHIPLTSPQFRDFRSRLQNVVSDGQLAYILDASILYCKKSKKPFGFKGSLFTPDEEKPLSRELIATEKMLNRLML